MQTRAIGARLGSTYALCVRARRDIPGGRRRDAELPSATSDGDSFGPGLEAPAASIGKRTELAYTSGAMRRASSKRLGAQTMARRAQAKWGRAAHDAGSRMVTETVTTRHSRLAEPPARPGFGSLARAPPVPGALLVCEKATAAHTSTLLHDEASDRLRRRAGRLSKGCCVATLAPQILAEVQSRLCKCGGFRSLQRVPCCALRSTRTQISR